MLILNIFSFPIDTGSSANQNENISTAAPPALGSPTTKNAPGSPTSASNSPIVEHEELQQLQTTLVPNVAPAVSTASVITQNSSPENHEICLTPPQRRSTNSNEYQQQSTPKSSRNASVAPAGAIAAVESSSPVHESNSDRLTITNEESLSSIESSTLNESQLISTNSNTLDAGGGSGGIVGLINTNNGSSNLTNNQNQQIISNYQATSTVTAALGNSQNGANRSYNPIMIPQRQSLLPWGTNSRSSIVNVIPYTTPMAPTSTGMISTAALTANQLEINDANSLRPGEIVMRNLFSDFTLQAEKKIELVMLESVDKPLSKLLQRGEDQQFDQLLSALGSVAEHCLPSLLHTLLAWHKRQLSDAEIKNDLKRMEKSVVNLTKPLNSQDIEFQLQRREAAVEFIFCLALIEILKQLPFHPGHEDLVRSIENLAFKHFKYKEGLQNNPNAHNIHMIADLYAEVIGVLAQSRFSSVRKRFMSELKELRAKEPSPHTTQSIISLLMGMKFFRVKVS